MAKFYAKLSEIQQNVFIMAAVGIIGGVILLPFALLGYLGLSLGFVLGTVIEILCYLMLTAQSRFLLAAANGSKPKAVGLALLFPFARIALYVGGLVLGAFATFRWSGNFLNVFTIAAAYLPTAIILAVRKLIAGKKEMSMRGSNNKGEEK